MHPAPSLILFSSLTGLGLGLLAWLAVLGFASPPLWVLGLALAGAGFLASTRHLRRPSRAILAFTQWRTSWLSREAILAVLALGVLTLHGTLLVTRGESSGLLGSLGALLALGTVL